MSPQGQAVPPPHGVHHYAMQHPGKRPNRALFMRQLVFLSPVLSVSHPSYLEEHDPGSFGVLFYATSGAYANLASMCLANVSISSCTKCFR
jgi:hypothetical protein